MDASTSSSFIDSKPKLIYGKIVWSGGPSIRQNFSLPESIMFYMARNPSTAEVYNKLIQTCKYFFEKHPILVVADIYGNTKICPNEDCLGNEECCVKIDLNKFSSKFWFTNMIFPHDSNTSSILCSKIYRCENSTLKLFDQNLMYNNFKLLASSAKNVELVDVKITNADGSMVMLETIFETVQNVEKFCYAFGDNSSVVTPSAVIATLRKLGNLTELVLYNIPELPNLEDFSAFIKDPVDIKFSLWFHNNLSEEYKTQLNVLVDDIVASGLPNRLIWYEGQNEENRKIMFKRR
uniref:Uncharacterized protein n=1 Tax=Panagrolaimus sp. ES5 TaxID=591445 RepID=A0AC34GVM4_9BILA